MMNFSVLSGLPRSGSTLLLSILAQNPSIYSNHASVLLPMINNTRDFWCNAKSVKAASSDTDHLKRTLRGMLSGYYQHARESELIIDKDRAWNYYLDVLDTITGRKTKVICLVRPPAECVSSFLRLYKNDPLYVSSTERNSGPATIDVARSLADFSGVVGASYSGIYEAAVVGNKLDQMLFIDYHKLCENPQAQIDRIYNFFELKSFSHNFKNVINNQTQIDSVYSSPDSLHKIEKVVRPGSKDLGAVKFFIDQVDKPVFWDEWT